MNKKFLKAKHLIYNKDYSLEQACKKVGIDKELYLQLRKNEHQQSVEIEDRIAKKTWGYFALFLILALIALLIILIVT